ncbi:hypothetical protein GTP81_04770 [Rugamonas sp. FT107W]|uniref:Uncharacterized protein n=1 Tax=Duganella vulcania TaxID=2692166 RepID=A0A845HCS9_9BURK|nr:hypothetical protein [Duganella vulcania]MYN16057.1 hypothetical protein [Duganella vulcania]
MKIILLLCICLSFSHPIKAQTTVLVPSTRWNPASVPKSPSEVHDAWQGGVDAVAWWVNIFAEKAVQKNVSKLINESMVTVAKDLAWTGGGALVNVRLIRMQAPDTPLQAVGILGDSAWFAGIGRTPEEALFEYWKTPQLRPEVPKGWTEDPLGSNYFWVQIDASGKPRATVVPRGLAVDLDQRLRENFGQYALEYYRKSWAATDTWSNIAREARSRMTEQAARKKVDDAWASVKASQARVAEANIKLEEALESERRTSKALQTIKLMQGILTVAQMIQEVRSTLNEPVPELSAASNAAAVINVTENIYKGRKDSRVTMLAAFDGSLADLQGFLNSLRGLAKQAGAPLTVDQKMTVGPRPVLP